MCIESCLIHCDKKSCCTCSEKENIHIMYVEILEIKIDISIKKFICECRKQPLDLNIILFNIVKSILKVFLDTNIIFKTVKESFTI